MENGLGAFFIANTLNQTVPQIYRTSETCRLRWSSALWYFCCLNYEKQGIYITSSQPLNLFWFLMKNDRESTKLKTNVLENITPGDWVKIEMSTKLNYKIIC